MNLWSAALSREEERALVSDRSEEPIEPPCCAAARANNAATIRDIKPKQRLNFVDKVKLLRVTRSTIEYLGIGNRNNQELFAFWERVSCSFSEAVRL
jgi:hypothetical protein